MRTKRVLCSFVCQYYKNIIISLFVLSLTNKISILFLLYSYISTILSFYDVRAYQSQVYILCSQSDVWFLFKFDLSDGLFDRTPLVLKVFQCSKDLKI